MIRFFFTETNAFLISNSTMEQSPVNFKCQLHSVSQE